MGLRSLDEDPDRPAALQALAGSADALVEGQEQYRSDPDAVLVAVTAHASALNHACEELRHDRTFALEAVHRNCKALEFLPLALRADRAVVLEAVSQKWSLLRFASEELRNDLYLSLEARMRNLAELPVYEGECLRLVGHCNGWRTTDALLRFKRCPAIGGSEAGSMRHRLVAKLASGCLSFQVLSCTWLSKFRVFPASGSAKGRTKLVKGDPFAVAATVGDKHGGHGQNFYIHEERGTVVSIYVELVFGAARHQGLEEDGISVKYCCRGTAVWYAVEQGQGQEDVVSLFEDVRDEQQAEQQARKLPERHSFMTGALASKIKVVAVDELVKSKFKDLLFQAREMGERTFPTRWRIRDLGGDRQLFLLVDTACTRAFGYCIQSNSKYESGATWINEFTVSATHRGKGWGSALLRWIVARLSASGKCKAVQLTSFNTAVAFYRKLGFVDGNFPTVSGCKALELRLLER